MSTTITLKDHWKDTVEVTLADPIAVADIFDKAADNITADTWIRGHMRSHVNPNRMCALGHLRDAHHGNVLRDYSTVGVGVDAVASSVRLIDFNDRLDRRPYQVKRRLKTIARQIRKQAEKAAQS